MKIYEYNGKKNVCGERVRQARVIKKLSQADLAARMQVKDVVLERNAISRIEMCDRFVTDFELMILAEVLGVSIEWLLGKNNDYSVFA